MSHFLRSVLQSRSVSSRSFHVPTKPQTVCSFYEFLTPNEGGILKPTDVVISRGYLLPETGKAALIDSIVPPTQIRGFLSQFNLTSHDVQYVVITGRDLLGDACELAEHFPNAAILAPASVSGTSDPETSQSNKITYVTAGDSVTIGTSRRLSFFELSSHIAVHDHLYANVFTGTSFAISLSSTYTPSHSLLLPPAISAEDDFKWPQNYLDYVDSIATSGCKRVYIHGGGPIENVKEATEHLRTSVSFLVDVLQAATWRARDGKTLSELTKWIEKELTQFFVQCGRDAMLSNQQMTKAGTLKEWLEHVPVLVAKSLRLAASARPIPPSPLRVVPSLKPRVAATQSGRTNPNKLWLRWVLFGKRVGFPSLLIYNLPALLVGLALSAGILSSAEFLRKKYEF